MFDYKDGNLYWKVSPSYHIKEGMKAGNMTKRGYVKIRLEKKYYLLHRLIWMWHNGSIPDGFYIDHINGNKADSRIENLRLATKSQNMQNRDKPSNNTSGVKGVCRWKNRWRVQFSLNHKQYYFGTFDTLPQAENRAKEAVIELHKEFAK